MISRLNGKCTSKVNGDDSRIHLLDESVCEHARWGNSDGSNVMTSVVNV